MAAKNNLIIGITDLLILSILKEKGDSYVYDVSKYIASSSNGLLSISHNTVYTVMYKLEERKMVSEYAKLVGKKGHGYITTLSRLAKHTWINW